MRFTAGERPTFCVLLLKEAGLEGRNTEVDDFQGNVKNTWTTDMYVWTPEQQLHCFLRVQSEQQTSVVTHSVNMKSTGSGFHTCVFTQSSQRFSRIKAK